MIAEVRLDDPKKRNALSVAMFDSLDAQLAKATDAAVIRLQATGTAFCAGFDLEACVSDPDLLPKLVERLGSVVARLRGHRAIVIAEVNGPAIAGGCALATAADFLLALPSATFGYPVHRIGLSPAVSLPTLLETMPAGAARALALSGEIIDAERALHLGLVHRIDESLAAAGARLAERLAGFSRAELLAAKASFGAPSNGRETAATISSAKSAESRSMLEAFWSERA